MRKTKQIDVELEDGTKKQVVVKELSVSQIEGLLYEMDLQKFVAPDVSLATELEKFFGDKLIPTTTTLTLDEVRHMYPSDVERVILTIQEVNKSFFTLMVKLNIVEWAKGLLQVFSQNLVSGMVSGQPAANSLKQDTPMPQTTDIPIS